MDDVLTRDRGHQRSKGGRRPVVGVHVTDSMSPECLEDAFGIALSACSHRIHDPALLVDFFADDFGGSDASTGRRRSYHFRSRSPVNAFDEHLLQIHLSEQSTLEAYAKRTDHLRLIVEEEGRRISEDSERDFWDFVHRHPFAQTGQVIVTDEGHLRLVWKGDDESHIGIRFLGGRRVRHVIFNRRAGERILLETSGEDSFDGLVSQAHACGLQVFRV